MAEPVVEALKEISRTLKEISATQKEQARILKTIAENYIAVNQPPDSPLLPPLGDEPTEPKYEPKTYGWSMAASVQREGGLKAGDIKVEQDDSRWVWLGEHSMWERVEEPSARESD